MGVVDRVVLGGPGGGHEMGVGVGENVEVVAKEVRVYGGELVNGSEGGGGRRGVLCRRQKIECGRAASLVEGRFLVRCVRARGDATEGVQL